MEIIINLHDEKKKIVNYPLYSKDQKFNIEKCFKKSNNEWINKEEISFGMFTGIGHINVHFVSVQDEAKSFYFFKKLTTYFCLTAGFNPFFLISDLIIELKNRNDELF